MITGTVDRDGVPVVQLPVAGQTWTAIIDTGFNGDLQLPDSLQHSLNARWNSLITAELANGQTIYEDSFIVDFTFDGQTIRAEATFAPVGYILMGTHFLRDYRLEVDFVARTVLLTRVAANP